jgi:molybdopterin converting factor small subunit
MSRQQINKALRKTLNGQAGANQPSLLATLMELSTRKIYGKVNANTHLKQVDRVLNKSDVVATFPGNIKRIVKVIGLGGKLIFYFNPTL